MRENYYQLGLNFLSCDACWWRFPSLFRKRNYLSNFIVKCLRFAVKSVYIGNPHITWTHAYFFVNQSSFRHHWRKALTQNQQPFLCKHSSHKTKAKIKWTKRQHDDDQFIQKPAKRTCWQLLECLRGSESEVSFTNCEERIYGCRRRDSFSSSGNRPDKEGGR